PDGRRCRIENVHTVLVYYLPKSAIVWIAWYSFEHQCGGSGEKRSIYNIGVTGNPSYICSTPENIALLILKYISESIIGINHIPSTSMHHALGLSCGARRI